MKWLVQYLAVDQIEAHWPMAAPMLERALRYTDRTDMSCLLRDLLTRKALLWVVYPEESEVAMVFVTRQVQYDLKLSLVVELAAGSGLSSWLPTVVATLRNYARDIGADRLEMYGRKGWLRQLSKHGWAQKTVIMECDVAPPARETGGS